MPDPGSTPPTPKKSIPVLIGAGVFVMVLGFGLPFLMPNTPTEPVVKPPTEPAIKPESPAAGVATPPSPMPGIGGALVKLVVSLALVGGMCVVAARYLRRPVPPPTGELATLASLRVTPRCIVHLVRVGTRRLLVGTDGAGVKALVELPGPEPMIAPSEAVSASPATSPPIPATLPETEAVVVGPVTMPVPTDRDELLTLLARLRSARPESASPPG